nr:immunoglobulin heavy chain junction region [Mus musculus]
CTAHDGYYFAWFAYW